MTFDEWAKSVSGTGVLRASCGYENRAARAAWEAAIKSCLNIIEGSRFGYEQNGLPETVTALSNVEYYINKFVKNQSTGEASDGKA